MVVLILGVVTDYSIFFLSRFREGLEIGESRLAAARDTAAEISPIVGVAGITVAVATAALLVAHLAFFRAFGPGLAATVVVWRWRSSSPLSRPSWRAVGRFCTGRLVQPSAIPSPKARLGPDGCWADCVIAACDRPWLAVGAVPGGDRGRSLGPLLAAPRKSRCPRTASNGHGAQDVSRGHAGVRPGCAVAHGSACQRPQHHGSATGTDPLQALIAPPAGVGSGAGSPRESTGYLFRSGVGHERQLRPLLHHPVQRPARGTGDLNSAPPAGSYAAIARAGPPVGDESRLRGGHGALGRDDQRHSR